MVAWRFGSLFSGIGGLELGLERAFRAYGFDVETVFQVECSRFGLHTLGRHTLGRHWPNARRYPDVREVTGAELGPVELLCGGSPCQDFSLTGPRRGLAGARSGLWSEYSRLIGELRPLVVVWENVPGALCPTKLDGVLQTPGCASVLADLHAHGYDADWTVLSAAQVGASHLRERLFVIGYRRGVSVKESLYSGRVRDPGEAPVESVRRWTARPGVALDVQAEREVTGRAPPYHRERIEALGNAVVPSCALAVGAFLIERLTAMRHPERAPELLLARALRAPFHGFATRELRARLGQGPGGISLERARWSVSPGSWPARGTARNGVAWAVESEGTERRACAVGGCEESEGLVGYWPTATARDWCSGKVGELTLARNNSRPLNETAARGGLLSPDWTERHMGFPEGWTAPGEGAPRPLPRDHRAKSCPV